MSSSGTSPLSWSLQLLKAPAILVSGQAPVRMKKRQAAAAGRRAARVFVLQQEQWPGAAAWLRLLSHRVAAACRLRNLARILGAAALALLLVVIATKGLSLRAKRSCRCQQFRYSACEPYDGNCGLGVKRAFCKQPRCRPKRKLVRCHTACANKGNKAPGCVYVIRRRSRWTACGPTAKVKTRILFLHQGDPALCPATKTERRRCSSSPRGSAGCVYESFGSWSQCNRERNEIVNWRRLLSGGASCRKQLVDRFRCLRRDGSPKCVYSRWTAFSRCRGGVRSKTRTLVQGNGCRKQTRIEQNCAQLR